uniref:Cilia- and flagella-associated protein 45 n=1 Tax=Glossina morsitans morsitans TaxID=37546 RepID=A0A1B0FB63_GLOMM
MPCFSACAERAQSHIQEQEPIDRAKTAARNGSDVNLLKFVCKKPNQHVKCRNVFYTPPIPPREARASVSRKVQLPHKELERLKAASKVVTLEDRLDDLMKKETELRRLEEEAERTRERFKKIDDARKKKAEEIALVQKGEEVQDKLQVLEKAFLAKHEQEEEVKEVNRIILNAKCHAVRDAQIQERSKLFKELRKEEIRLEQQVIERAMKSLNEEDEQFDKKQEAKQKYAEEIKKQLLERENQRFLEAERTEKEAKMLRDINEAFKRDEERQHQLSKERRSKFRDELAQVVEMSNVFKQRDRKRQRLFNLAQKALESRSQRDEITYLRQRENLEREYRQKEKQAALKKKQIEKELSDAREHQMQETKHRQALQVVRAEQDFNVLVERLKKEEEEDRKLNIERQRKRNCYRMDIIRQMGDKEMERRRLLDLERSEASDWRERERQRDANIKAVINAKLAAMRDACLPEKYIKDVEMQLQRITNNQRQKLAK